MSEPRDDADKTENGLAGPSDKSAARPREIVGYVFDGEGISDGPRCNGGYCTNVWLSHRIIPGLGVVRYTDYC